MHARSRDISSNIIHLGVATCAAFALTVKPSQTGRFEFRYMPVEESLTLSFSKSSPPLAAVEDELLPPIQEEPRLPLSAKPGRKLLTAGQAPWGQLKRYSIAFSKYSKPLIKLNEEQGPKATVIVRQAPRIPISPDKVKLVIAIPISEIPKNLPANETPTVSVRAPVVPSPLAWVAPKVNAKEILAKEIGIEPVKEEVKSARVISAFVPPPLKEVARIAAAEPPLAKPSQSSQPTARTRTAEEEEYMRSLWDKNQNNADTGFMTESVGKKGVSFTPGQKDLFRIEGTVELSGGLALAGELTKLSIKWRYDDQIRKGSVNLQSGTFQVPVPALGKGKVIATLSNAKGKMLGVGEADLEVLGLPLSAYQNDVRIMIEPIRSQLVGTVYNAQASGESMVPIRGAEVFGPAAGRETTDRSGLFRMGAVTAESTFILETFAPLSWSTRQIASGHLKLRTPVFPDRMMDSFFGLIKQSSGSYDGGVVWGQVTQGGRPLTGITVGISTPNAVGPIYFNKAKIPDLSLKATSENGMYAFVKVSPGLHIVFASQGKTELPSTVVNTAAHAVSPGDIKVRQLEVKGQIYDPVEKKAVAGQINVIGYSGSATATDAGFKLKFPSSDSVIFFQARPKEADYLMSRQTVSRVDAQQDLELLSFKKSWLTRNVKQAGLQLNPLKSVVIGYVRGPSFHIHAEGPPRGEFLDENIYYFNEKGEIDLSATEGIADGGGFIITNMKAGPLVIVASSITGDVSTSRVVVTEPGIINTLVIDLEN